METSTETTGIEISEPLGQRWMRLREMPPADSNIGELSRAAIRQLHLPANDAQGNALAYHAKRTRGDTDLLESDRVGDMLQPGDQVVLRPNVMAGGPATA